MPAMMQIPEMGPIKELFAVIAGAAAAINAWLSIGDRLQARDEGRNAYREIQEDSSLDSIISELSDVIPIETWHNLLELLKNCSQQFNDILENPDRYFPDQVTKATIPFKRCICEVLSMIIQVYGKLPLPSHNKLWKLYDCPVLLRR